MIYLVINLTAHGTGYEVIGSFRSYERAWRIRDLLDDANSMKDSPEDDNSYHVLSIEPLDKYTDESIIEAYRIKETE